MIHSSQCCDPCRISPPGLGQSSVTVEDDPQGTVPMTAAERRLQDQLQQKQHYEPGPLPADSVKGHPESTGMHVILLWYTHKHRSPVPLDACHFLAGSNLPSRDCICMGFAGAGAGTLLQGGSAICHTDVGKCCFTHIPRLVKVRKAFRGLASLILWEVFHPFII